MDHRVRESPSMLACVADLRVRDEFGRSIGEESLKSSEEAANALATVVAPSALGPFLPLQSAPGSTPTTSHAAYGRDVREDHELARAIHDDGDRDWLGARRLEVFLFVQAEDSTGWQRREHAAVEGAEVACELFELALDRLAVGAKTPREEPQRGPCGEAVEDLGIEVWPLVTVVHAEGLEGEAAIAGLALEPWYRCLAALGPIAPGLAEEPAARAPVLLARAIRTPRGYEVVWDH